VNGATADRDGDGDVGIGLLLLAADGSIERANPAAMTWLAALDDGGPAAERPPSVVRSVADRARALAAGRASGEPAASARVRTRTGRYVLVRGSTLGEGSDARAVVMLEALRPPELAPPVADAHGLTARERAVTQLVAQGLPTAEIGQRLFVSPYTVQDHLKAIFDKVGVRTRGELVARLYFDHDAPRRPGARRASRAARRARSSRRRP
jgi:DNA-binding CsgD family transcriptional regulator